MKNRKALTSEEQTWRSMHTLKLISLGWNGLDASMYSYHFPDMPSPHRVVSTHLWGCKSFGCQCVVDRKLQ